MLFYKIKQERWEAPAEDRLDGDSCEEGPEANCPEMGNGSLPSKAPQLRYLRVEARWRTAYTHQGEHPLNSGQVPSGAASSLTPLGFQQAA